MPGLQRPEREQGQRHAERERKGRGEDDARPHDGEAAARPAPERAPFAGDDRRKREGREGDGGDGEHADPEQRRERVVEDAVADEAEPPGVPEVVPEHVAVADEQRPLVRVRCQVGAGRAQPGQDGGDDGSRRRAQQRLTSHRTLRPHGRKRTVPA